MTKMKLKRFLVLASSVFLLSGCSFSGASMDGRNIQGINSDKSFSMVASWTTSGLLNHYNTNTNCNAFDYFVVEGLYRYVRSTDEIYCQLAETMPEHFTVNLDDYKKEIGVDAVEYYAKMGKTSATCTRAKIRYNATWQNGEEFTAKDVWSYYYIMHPTSSNYMIAVKVVDDLTVDFIWNPLKEPTNKVKELLIAQDKNGTVKYDEFAKYVEPVHEIVMASPVNENIYLWGAFNRFSTAEQIVRLTKIKNKFFETSPRWYIATGPFKLATFSATQILLKKNEFYWNAKNIKFDKIKLYSSNDLNQTYQLITTDKVDYYDGFIQYDTLQSILESNRNIVNLKMYDPGSIGIIFNFKSKYMTDEVREAFQYIFNRESITKLANPYATTSYYPLLGMAASEAYGYMSKEAYENLPKYSNQPQIAGDLLEKAGWYKVDGRWYKDGSEVILKLGAPDSSDIASTSAEAAAAQLEAFGIGVQFIKTSNFYSEAIEESCRFDLLLEWTDLNLSFSYPTGSYNQFSNVYSKWAHLPRYADDYWDTQKAGSVKLSFRGIGEDTTTYEFADYINTFYSVNSEELTNLVNVFNTGLAKMNIGIQFFQNVTASTLNAAKVSNIPLQQYWEENRNVSYVPEFGTDDFYAVARTNLVFANDYLFAYGIYEPNVG